MKRIFVFLVTIALFLNTALGCKTSSYADGGDKIVRVGYYLSDNFQEGALGSLPKTGYSYEYLQKISYYTGWKYQYVYGNFEDLFEMLKTGRIDVLAGIPQNEDFLDDFLYPQQSMGYEKYYLFFGSGSTDNATIDSSDLKGKKVGMIKNNQLETAFDAWNGDNLYGMKPVYFDSEEARSAALLRGEIDAIISGIDAYSSIEGISVVSEVFQVQIYLCISKGNEEILSDLNNAHKMISETEPRFMENLQYKYYGKAPSNVLSNEEEKSYFSSHPTITIGYMDNYLPYCATDDNGNPTGVLTDIVPEMLRELGIENVEISYIPYKNYQDMVRDIGADRLDAIFPSGGDLWFAERNETYVSNPVFTTSVNMAYKEYNDETLKKIAVNRNNLLQYYYITSNYPDAEIMWYDSVDACLKAVLKGEAGCTIMDGLRVTNILKNSEYKELLSITMNDSEERCFAVKSGNTELLAILNHGISEMGEEYAIGISYNYMDALYEYTTWDLIHDYAGRLSIAGAILALLIIGSLLKRYHELRRQNKIDDERNRELSEALEEAENAREAMAAVCDTLDAAKWQLDYTVGGRITDIWLSDELKKMLGYTENCDLEELKNISQMNSEDRKKIKEAFANLIQDRKGKCGINLEYCEERPDGSKKWFQVMGRSALKAGRREGRFYGLFRDITLKKVQEIAEYEAATYDALTGLFNRHSYEEDMDELKKKGKWLPEIVVLTLDINRLKQINDTLGHAAGDELIQGAASVVSEVFSSCGKCYRTGGDEFVVIMQGENIPVDKLKEELASKVVAWSGELVKQIEISVGWASSLENANMDIDDLIRISDRNMYEDKAAFYRRKGIDRRT